MPDFRFGSKADITAHSINVRFTPETGHSLECTNVGASSVAIEASCNRANGKCKVPKS
jgi:hypothetical protein